ncbi:histone-fold-containing protein [Clohesyomyces aquaticus]|uniref:Histone-fold-containing protein n=1 Tax=Clohesyomyces aquaticus TaxID=1231657 RepID=A0A1Y2AA48_9PLEO|nr:histone-fold-containing protein [Clohesyomyces aquaticus]
MSSTPPKKEGVEPGAQSPDDSEPHMDRDAHEAQAQGLGYEFEVKEQDRWLPIANASVMSSPSPRSSTSPPPRASKNTNNNIASDANIRNFAPVARIMKMALPENAKIAKEAKECMQECVSEFISFITSEASEKCQQEKRKTVNGEDILFAMTSLGFENYAEALKIYLSRYRETLLANQSKPPAGGFNAGGASGANSGANAAAGSAAFGQAENAQHNNVLGGDAEMAEQDNTSAFGYTVHNGNGNAEF